MQDSTPKTDARIEEQNADLQTQAMLAKKARAERIKKMRGWLSPRDSVHLDCVCRRFGCIVRHAAFVCDRRRASRGGLRGPKGNVNGADS